MRDVTDCWPKWWEPNEDNKREPNLYESKERFSKMSYKKDWWKDYNYNLTK